MALSGVPILSHQDKCEVLVSKRAWTSCEVQVRKARVRTRLERRPVQILVVVANIQMRTLKTEVGKGSARTAIGRGLVGPKAKANAEKYAVVHDTTALPKGKAVNIPLPAVGYYAATQTNPQTSACVTGRVIFSF